MAKTFWGELISGITTLACTPVIGAAIAVAYVAGDPKPEDGVLGGALDAIGNGVLSLMENAEKLGDEHGPMITEFVSRTASRVASHALENWIDEI